ncbi:glutamic-type intramembrane protease PrsW [Sutcliffiella cohnii]|uniref:glutamic-type intramembrane protease PrsW n=1 Tax=Sutcliffiella cohnii TaxID=33932 RepID=UPI002E1FA85F|nr:glutamic-type intramembrane protease PrsW [Sutcliffiella cohnii]MED4017267.1 glutamic-type intramembrane protease PrsW [Sutcliffiella cohnii]
MIAIISAGFAPGIALLTYFYLKDRFQTEPISNVIKLFFVGAILVFPLMFIQYVISIEIEITSSIIQAFFVTAMLEEFFKWFFIIYIIYHHIHFDEHYDGIIYGMALSLGFATAENILYLLANGIEFALGRALLPVSSHALFGIIMGYYLGCAKFAIEKKKTIVYLALALFIPIVLHGLYDYILMSGKQWGFYMLPFMIFLWWLGLKKVRVARKSYTI